VTSTALSRPTELWNAMPGWGIVADLTPPELTNSRQLKVLRKLLATALVALLVLCLAGYVLASRKQSAAASALASVQARTTLLTSDAGTYAGITRIQGTMKEVQTKIATLMGGDVDLATLIARIRSSLPTTMTIKQESITLSLAAVASAGAANSASGGLDTSGRAHIGTISLSGTGRTLDDLSAFVDTLTVIPGVVDVMPVSNVTDKTGMTYGVSLNLTDALLSHHFDVASGGK
jgi:hypothetical protein